MSTHLTTRDLDLGLIDKDAEGVIKPGPGVVYDGAGIGIVFIDVGTSLEAVGWPRRTTLPRAARDLALAVVN